MNEAQEDIYEDMQSAWVSKKYNKAFRADCERLVKAGAIVVDIGAAVATLQASPELCETFSALLGKEDPLKDKTYMVRHNPNCPKRFEVRLTGAGLLNQSSGDQVGYGDTYEEAATAALAAPCACCPLCHGTRRYFVYGASAARECTLCR